MLKSKTKCVNDLGVAAYIKLHGYRCLGRKGRNYYFEVENNDIKFEKLIVEYINSSMHDFDSALMSLKKIGEYVELE